MSSTATNKQPLLVDRPLNNCVLVTTQIVGTSGTVNVQGGQVPQVLVDMDAARVIDTNNGGVIESVQIVRQRHYRPVDYQVTTATSGDTIALTPEMTVEVVDTASITTTTPAEGAGVYTYTGAADPLVETNTDIHYSGGLVNGFSYVGEAPYLRPSVQFAFYKTRLTTTPIPGQGDYKLMFVATVPQDQDQIDCTQFMPVQSTPVPASANVSGLAAGEPVRNRGIFLQRGDRLYVGVVANGPFAAGISNNNDGFAVSCQGGYF